jgi:hypothetical protein
MWGKSAGFEELKDFRVGLGGGVADREVCLATFQRSPSTARRISHVTHGFPPRLSSEYGMEDATAGATMPGRGPWREAPKTMTRL